MPDNYLDEEELAKLRCADFLLEMFQKYDKEVKKETNKNIEEKK